jgi:zeta-carotene desaturase
MWDAIVIGAGCSGLSAATALAEKGKRVLVLERRPLLGGRASSFADEPTGETLDNGQHLFLGCYLETKRYLNRIGSLPLLKFMPSFEAVMAGPDGTRSRLKSLPLPAPWNLAFGLLGYRALSIRERLAAFRVARAAMKDEPGLDSISVAEWLGRLRQTSRSRARLWDPLVLATLNIDPERAPARLLSTVLKEGFLGSRGASQVGLSSVGLSDLHGLPSRRFIEDRGGEVRLRTVAKGFAFVDRGLRGVELADGLVEEGRAIVAAVPPTALSKLAESAPLDLARFLEPSQSLISSPIVSLHVWFDRDPFSVPVVGLWDQKFHWAFRRASFLKDPDTRHFCLVTSAADEMVAVSKAELTGWCESEMGRLAGHEVRVDRAVMVRESEATWIPPLGRPGSRLKSDTPVANLFLSGDWTATGLPATIEGAVLSGHRAAEGVLRLT